MRQRSESGWRFELAVRDQAAAFETTEKLTDEILLVVAMGEFGRTPKIGQVTVGVNAMPTGRDHWSHCFTVLMGSAGIRTGAIFSSSDKHAGYPASNPVSPEDINVTIYYALGIAPETRITDPFGQPYAVALGEPILELFG